MSEETRLYSVFGLCIASEVPLPELPEVPKGAIPDLRIRIGPIPHIEGGRTGLSIFPDGALLRIDEVGRFWMTDGREMIVEPDSRGSERNLRLYLLGSAIAAILHQRSLLPLHANAIVVEGQAVAFMGHPGAGKSTLAAWFHDRGFEFLADDVCVVTWDDAGRPFAHQGIPRLRLWREALEASGREASDYERSFDDMDKFTVPTDTINRLPAVPLSQVYLLEKAGEGEEPGVIRLRGSAAVEALVANTYRGGYVPMMGHAQEHFLACARLSRAVPVFSAKRRWSLADFDAEAAALEMHARQFRQAVAL